MILRRRARRPARAGPLPRSRRRRSRGCQHPNIVQVYEVGEHEGRPFFALEFVEGGSLDRAARRHAAAGPPRRPQLRRDAGPAPSHARPPRAASSTATSSRPTSCWTSRRHARRSPTSASPSGSTARAPAQTQDRRGRWARPATWPPSRRPAATATSGRRRTSTRWGHPLRVLTGRPPFRADTVERDRSEQVLHDEPAAADADCSPDVPRDLETICLKCLEKEPARRYASAGDWPTTWSASSTASPWPPCRSGDGERLARLAARDGYQIVSEIGRGPRSIVYRALYGPLKQPVALKVFAAGPAREENGRPGFGAAPSCGPRSPTRIVPSSAPAGGTASRTWPSSTSRTAAWPPAREPSRSDAAVLRLVEQLAEIVCYLHRQGVVHGNLKPSNVLLAADGIPRVVDFRPTGRSVPVPLPADDTTLPALGYLAPELAATRREAARHRHLRTGAILYELLTGRPPFARRRRGRRWSRCARSRSRPRASTRGDTVPGGVLPALSAEEPVAALPPHVRPVDAAAALSGQPGGEQAGRARILRSQHPGE